MGDSRITLVAPVNSTSSISGHRGLVGTFRRPAVRFLLRRLSQALMVMLLVVLMNFTVLQLAPGDMIDVLAGQSDMTAEQMANMRQQYGLDQPVIVQLVRYLMNLVTFDLGYSFRNSAPVLDVILSRFPTTLMLVVPSVLLSLVIGTVLGIAAARNAGKPLDFLILTAALLLYALPSFIVAILLILVFGVFLNLAPIGGLVTVGAGLTGIDHVMDLVSHLALPVVALCTFYTAIYARLTRASMLEVSSLDYVRTARAKGIGERRVIYVHALRNALMPIITMAGLQVSSLIGGAVLIETVFGLPGMGRAAFDAIFERDTSLLLGVMFVSSLSVVLVSLAIDLIYVALDPRLELK